VLMSLAPVSLWQEVVEVIIGGNNSISDWLTRSDPLKLPSWLFLLTFPESRRIRSS
jgi:hypothetical protein